MLSRYLLKTIKTLIFVGVIATPLFYIRTSVYPYTLPKTAFFQGVVEILFFAWLTLIIFDKKYRPKWTPLLIGLMAFLSVMILTSIFGVDASRSFWSTQERAFGVVSFLHFGALALVLSSLYREINWKRLIYASLGTASLVTVIAFLQIGNPNILLNEPIGSRPGSTFGNPIFLAGYLLFNIFLGLYFLIASQETTFLKKINKRSVGEKIFLIAAIILSTAGIFRTQTRGDILGLAFGILVLISLFAFRPPETKIKFFSNRKLYLAVVLGIIAFGSVFWLTRASSFWNGVPGLNRFKGISLQEQSFQPRLIAIKASYLGFLERPFFGWGWDNFNIVFNKYYDPKALEISYQETRFDKPHNAFLEYLVAGGAILGLAYAAFILTFLFQVWRLKDRLLAQIIIALTADYLVRNLVSFETIGPLIMFCVVLGFIDGLYREENLSLRHNEHERNVPEISGWALGISLIFSFIIAYMINIQSIQASNYQFWGFTNFARNKPVEAIQSFVKGTAIWNPYQSNFKRDYATAVAEAYFYNPEIIPKEEAKKAVRAMEEVASSHPLDAYNHYVLVDMYNQVSDIDPDNFLAGAEREAAIALELSPDRQEILFSLAKTKTIRGDHKAALELLDKALTLNPKVPDAHFYYGLVASASGDLDLGYKELKIAIGMGRLWKNYYEPRVVAGYFADAEHLEEAIDLYKTSLSMGPNDLETRIKIGIAYFFIGNTSLAREYLQGAAGEFDFSKSQAYGQLKPILDSLGIK